MYFIYVLEIGVKLRCVWLMFMCGVLKLEVRWNRKWLSQEALFAHEGSSVMTSQGLVERSHWESKYLLMLKPGGWSLFCAIAIGWMKMNWTLCKRMDELWELHWSGYMFIVFDLQEVNVCEYVCKRRMELIPKCNFTGARVAARGYWPAHRLQARVIWE